MCTYSVLFLGNIDDLLMETSGNCSKWVTVSEVERGFEELQVEQAHLEAREQQLLLGSDIYAAISGLNAQYLTLVAAQESTRDLLSATSMNYMQLSPTACILRSKQQQQVS
ncbi:uncharacterized protein T551_01505 [Pneumocystis jirovecii RU7]|uniref:Uncharacterized protein n=1 Tax=Pneumocystis jirovecii (strain RU7) TaxID=1408657 RepID=A0A0W4ZRF4_PNEJ7|nr:uncharacterized protein T551_01505 [Pneumocystis jirovecii RU7]KTW30953.1 hypothetical protein T551_01505 [Pneumocystis jirovecii RU7]